MSSSTACAPLKVVLKASRQELCFLILAHGLVLWAVVLSGFYFLLLLLAASIFYYLRRWLRCQGVCLLQLQDERCWLEDARGNRQHYRLGKRHFVTNFLVVVELMPEHRRFALARYLALFGDAADVETLRQLRVTLCLNQRAKPASSVVSE